MVLDAAAKKLTLDALNIASANVRANTVFYYLFIYLGNIYLFIYLLFIYLFKSRPTYQVEKKFGGCVPEVGVSEEGVCCKIIFL